MAFVITVNTVLAQKIDFNAIILPEGTKNVDYAEKLVMLAWQNNPENEILKSRASISQLQTKQAKWQWLEQIRVTGNINEFNIDPSSDVFARSQFFPRYNLGAFITLGNFVQNPLEVKVKRQESLIASETINSRKLALRAEVLRRYEQYKKDSLLLDLQLQATEDVRSKFSLEEEKFKRGEITLDEFSQALSIQNRENANVIIYQSNLAISKIDLEELIGVKLEYVN
ncbi:MAG: TolC family protein [Cyclobacteriaceae bacterium]